MDVNQIVTGNVIYIAPTSGDTTTAWSRPQKTEHIGKVNKGERYKAGGVNIDLGMVELDLIDGDVWPDSVQPMKWGGVWVDARFVSSNGQTPAPTEATWQGVLRAMLKAGLEALGE